MRENTSIENIYLEISNLIKEFRINRNKIFIVKFNNMQLKNKFIERLEKDKKYYLLDFLLCLFNIS